MNEIQNVFLNKFFSFLFDERIFKYWNVDITTARLIGKSKGMARMMVYWCNKVPGYTGLAMRDTSSNLNDSVIREIFDALREFDIRDAIYKLGDRELHFKNGNIIYFRGAQVKSKAQVTLSGFSADYKPKQWIVWLEEVYQFTPKQFTEIAQAVRHAPKTIFATSNPWLETNWYVSLMNKKQKFDKEKLTKFGKQIKSIFNEKEKRLIVYATVNNSPFLTKEMIAQLENDTEAQPWQHNPVILGMPGILSGAIYAHLMHKVEYVPPPKNNIIDEFIVGVDFGEISDSTSVVLICSNNNYQTVRVLEEFEYKPTKKYSLERDEIAILVNNKILEWKSKYKISLNDTLQVRYDNSAVVFGRRLKQLGVDYGIRYKPCSKDKIIDRINLVTMLMNEGRLIFKDNIIVLKREMRTSMWQINKLTEETIPERVDGNDHMINAFEYAIERRSRKLHLFNKLSDRETNINNPEHFANRPEWKPFINLESKKADLKLVKEKTK